MLGEFHKMHGLGNDFVVIDARTMPLLISPVRAKAIADRKTGIGCDQLILLEASQIADAKMRIFNADGSEVEACGNASRAVALLLGGKSKLETLGGALELEALGSNAKVQLDPPRFEWDSVPLAYAMDTRPMPVSWENLERPSAVNVGNPHIVFFVDDCAAIDLERLGPLIENDPLFPQRVNVNVANIAGPSALQLRVWERGVGITRACGTGACATAIAALQRGLVSGPVQVNLDGGSLEIDWKSGGPIFMTGPATHVYTGRVDWDQFR